MTALASGVPEYLGSGSQLERIAHCGGSVALPHAEHEEVSSDRGRALHKYLEAIPTVGAESAIDLVPDEWRASARALDLTGLDDRLQLAAEVALAYNVETDTARELARGAGRHYVGVTSVEVPMCLDVIGLDLGTELRRGLVVDWKTGWGGGRKSVAKHWQLYAGALALARAFQLDQVEVQLIHVSENAKPYVQRRVLELFDLDMFAAELAEVVQRAAGIRAAAAAGVVPSGLVIGAWCTHCPARNWCPARTSLIRCAADELDDVTRIRPLTPAMVASAWHRVRAVERLVESVKSAIYAAAREQPVRLRVDDDGTEHWLGTVIDEGREELDGAVVHKVLTELHGADAANAAVTYETSKTAIEAALKPLAARGKFAAMNRDTLAAIRTAGGAKKTPRASVKEYALAPGSRR